MGGARTKMDENSEYASGEYAGRHSLSPQHSVLSTIFVGVPHGPTAHQACPELVEGMDENDATSFHSYPCSFPFVFL